jgi:hypothetical protein
MIKGLRPGPTAQYFVRKPPQTLEKLLQKMDEYIRADNDFCQRREEAYRFSEMTRGYGGRIHPRHVRSIHNSSLSDDRGSQPQRPQHSSNLQGNNKAPSGHQSQGAEAAGATPQEHVKSPFRSKRRLPKLRRDRVSQSRSYIQLHATLPMYQST